MRCIAIQREIDLMNWFIPQWPVSVQVHAVCTTRFGGVSLPPYDSFNLAEHVGDAATAVAANRSNLQRAIGVRPVFLSQQHGTQVESITSDSADGMQADGSMALEPGVACTIMMADCLPVLLTNAQGSLVAAAHAGWRGLAGPGGDGILEAVVAAIGGHTSSILAWLGPCIGPEVFEVGADVHDLFVARDRAARDLFVPLTQGKWLADLQGLARLRLHALGVTQIYGNRGTRPWCTFSNPTRYFSYRRDRVSGRMAACIWLDRVSAMQRHE